MSVPQSCVVVQACCNLQIFKRKILKLQNTQKVNVRTIPVCLKILLILQNFGVLRVNKNQNSSLSLVVWLTRLKEVFLIRSVDLLLGYKFDQQDLKNKEGSYKLLSHNLNLFDEKGIKSYGFEKKIRISQRLLSNKIRVHGLRH